MPLILSSAPVAAIAQGGPTGDSVIARIYDEGMHHSHAYTLAQVLMDSIGSRLTGSASNRSANEWLVHTYATWGITAVNEKYGTWRDWTRGLSRIDLVAPRLRTLDATMVPWSAGAPAGGVTADVEIIPRAAETKDSAGFARWIGTLKGKFVLTSAPPFTCRPDSSWIEWAGPMGFSAMTKERDSANAEWRARTAAAGASARNIIPALEAAGVAGMIGNSWSRGWGTDKLQSPARSATIPTFDMSCEDYSMLARMADANQHPRIHAVADAKLAAQQSPVYNTIATVKGSEKPNEYVMLSAHLDSWDGGTGATDNGTGTITMLEAMRILRTAYPAPKRTIIAGHWSGEEEGDIGSSAYATDHPEILKGLQALFNQDNGTGNIDTVQTNGFIDAASSIARWMSRMPGDMTAGITLVLPGVPHDESTDSDAFDCANAPAFFLTSADYDYTTYTWHTNRDTFDKINFDEVRRNATIIAMLAYEASEDPQTVGRARASAPQGGRGRGRTPSCSTPQRSFGGGRRGPGGQ